ncbi:hypothetical protein V9T40_002324 [Parthenolecanium corni]|uniref:Uncharacterized protein n=1 Tax=Parthenolecanium corni TaxID=536013 RepID=A0AAN9TIA7_9HEMI
MKKNVGGILVFIIEPPVTPVIRQDVRRISRAEFCAVPPTLQLAVRCPLTLSNAAARRLPSSVAISQSLPVTNLEFRKKLFLSYAHERDTLRVTFISMARQRCVAQSAQLSVCAETR